MGAVDNIRRETLLSAIGDFMCWEVTVALVLWGIRLGLT